ncbi:MAG: ferritin family protein [Halanaerobiales bacterium]
MLNTSLNSMEVLEMAKNIELRGRDFYRNQAAKTDKEEMKELLNKLADDEDDHYQTFSKIEAEVREKSDDDIEYIYDPEVSAYLDALIQFSVFPQEGEVKVDSALEILDIAKQAEKDSILFYYEMLEYNEGKTKEVIKKLINEEKEHLLDLIKIEAELV